MIRIKSSRLSTFVGLAALGAVSLTSATALGQTIVTPTTDTTTLSESLLGSSNSVTVTSATFTGADGAIGTFLDGPFGINQGIVISSGLVEQMPFTGTNTSLSHAFNTDGHPLCGQLTDPAESFDAALLHLVFDVADDVDGIQFDYIVGSDEYPEYVGSGYNDGFGVFLNGINVALDNDGNPITINGPFFSGGNVLVFPDTQSSFNGSTPLLTSRVPIIPGSTDNELTIVICDAGDNGVDTGAFITALDGCFGDCEGTTICGNDNLDVGEVCDGTHIHPDYADCPSGYEGSPLCNNDPANPDANGTCSFDPVPAGCTDINECVEDPGICGTATCVNTPGSYECVCDPGYEFDGANCVDINECVEDPAICGPGTCENTPGSYECSCDSGYEFDGATCVDIDECVEDPAICGPGLCSNTTGSYECSCDSGFEFDGTTCVDINECVEDPAICGPGLCSNTPGSYECSCDSGYEYDGTTCVDINECVEDPAICGPGVCSNTPGSYECSCDSGYEFDGTSCVDINECVEDPAICGPGVCSNTSGSYECSCDSGFEFDGTTCVDIDECADASLNDCHEMAECTNTVGSYECGCEAGYSGDGEFCVVDLTIESPADQALTSDPRPVISGTGEPGETVTINIDGQTVGTAQVDANGQWTYTPTEDLPEGDVVVIVTDGYSDADVTITVDTVAPQVEILSPGDGEVFLEAPDITGEAEPLAQVDLFIDGEHLATGTVDEDGNFVFELEDGLDDGVYEVMVRATDAAGNFADDEISIVIDATAEVIILQPADGAVVRTLRPVVTGEAEPGASVEIFVDGVLVDTVVADENGQWSWQPDADMAEGEVEITAYADSPAGDREDSVTFEIDVSTTDVVITSPEDGALLNDERPAISGSAAPHAEVTIFVDGEERATVTADENGNWTWTPDEDLPQGESSITAVAEDDGIVTDTTVVIVIDTIPPTLDVIDPSDAEMVPASGAVVTGITEPGATVEVFVDGELIATVTADEDGTFTVAIPDGLARDEELELRVTATDEAGNVTVDERTFFVESDVELGTLSGGGLGCSAVDGSTDPSVMLLLLGVALLAVRRRRRSALK